MDFRIFSLRSFIWQLQTGPFGFWNLDLGFLILDFAIFAYVWNMHRDLHDYADSGRQIFHLDSFRGSNLF